MPMKILISGICGFVGSTLALALKAGGHEVFGFDNFIRPGSERNRVELKRRGIKVLHADVRSATDLDALESAEFVVDAAANPSVLAGVDGKSSSRQVVEHNLSGTINLLEYCKAHRSGFVLLSTSRVYAISGLSALEVESVNGAYQPVAGQDFPQGLSARGVAETYSTGAPISLYGATKLASECLALEYGETFGFPVWVNRCGVLAGGGQFGRADQGIFSYWINSWLWKKPLKFIGFDGLGSQVRDALHPRDLVPLLEKQFVGEKTSPRIVNVAGGADQCMSLAQLSAWCAERFGPHEVASEPQPRPFDIPWMVLDSGVAKATWGFAVSTPLDGILEEIALHAEKHPDWLELSAP